MKLPDWEGMAKVDAKSMLKFRAEDHRMQLHMLWNDIVTNPDRGANEVKAMMLRYMDKHEFIKMAFYTFLTENYETEEHINWGCDDVLRFMNKVSLLNERYLQKVENGEV